MNLLTFSLLLAQAGAAPSARDTTRLTLPAMVQRALASYPTLTAARALRDRAAADLREAQSAWLPRIQVDAGVNRFEEPMVVLPLHGFDPTNPPLFDRTLLQTGVSLGYTLFDFGIRSNRVRAQRALDDAAGAAVNRTEVELIARVVRTYLRIQSARDVLAAHDQRLTALDAEARRVTLMLAEGKAARVEALRVNAARRAAAADRIAGASQVEIAERELAQLAQLPPAAVRGAAVARLTLADTALAGDTAPATRAALASRARDASPDLAEFDRRLDAARAGASAARATRLPELRLSTAYVDRGRWWGDFAAEWQVGLAVSYPLFTGGGRGSVIRRAEADVRAAAAQREVAALGVEMALDRALAALREAHARVAALESATEQSAEVARIERLALDVGSGVQSDYLDAESKLLWARANLVEARHAEISARVELGRITGALSPDWLARTLESDP